MGDNDMNKQQLEFNVTLCLGGGDGGDVQVVVDVTDEEYELLKECYREDMEVEDCDGLEDLFDRIKEAAQDENEGCMADVDSDEEIEYDGIYYMVQIPDEIADEVDNEVNDNEEDDDTEEEIDLNDYRGYPFAMETVNGEIISLTSDFQEEITECIQERMNISREELIDGIKELEGKFDTRASGLLDSCGYDALVKITGYDEGSEDFITEGIGFLESTYGWKAKGLLEGLGYKLVKDIAYGPHGHDSNGVIYIPDGQT